MIAMLRCPEVAGDRCQRVRWHKRLPWWVIKLWADVRRRPGIWGARWHYYSNAIENASWVTR